jgi:YegS/Rv2252/BmrU family lipid kinase
MTAPWVAIQRNPHSGSGTRRRELQELIAGLRGHGLRPRLFSRRELFDRRLLEPRARDGLVCVVAAGGDGTICDVLNRMPGVPVAILPLGTENLMAKYLGITPSGRLVADMIAAGKTRRFDLCQVGSRRCFLMASFGFDADVIHRVHTSRRGNITKLTYFQPISQSLRKYGHPPMRLYFDGATSPIIARMAVVANLPLYAFGLRVVADACGDDGFLDVRMFQPESAFQMFRYLYKVVRGVHEALDDVTCVRAQRVRIESDVPVPVQADGDPAGWTPIEISVLPSAFECFVPANDQR